MNLCYAYSIKWRYKFNHVKSGIVTFGESKRVHSEAMKERTWVLAGESVTELCEYKIFYFLWWLECDIGDRRSDFETPISPFETPISDFEIPISDFVDQGVQAVLNTALLFSKRLLLNVTSDRNNPLLL